MTLLLAQAIDIPDKISAYTYSGIIGGAVFLIGLLKFVFKDDKKHTWLHGKELYWSLALIVIVSIGMKLIDRAFADVSWEMHIFMMATEIGSAKLLHDSVTSPVVKAILSFFKKPDAPAGSTPQP